MFVIHDYSEKLEPSSREVGAGVTFMNPYGNGMFLRHSASTVIRIRPRTAEEERDGRDTHNFRIFSQRDIMKVQGD